jgi:DNA mismatch repair protein MutS2
MDVHSLQILEYPKLRELLSRYTATSLGRELVEQLQPSTDILAIRQAQQLVSEMVATLGQGHAPSFGGITDIRLLVRRATIGAMLGAEQLLDVANFLIATGAVYRFKMRLDERCGRLIELLQSIDDLGPAGKKITGCIDARGHVLDMASAELAAVRGQLTELDERIKNQINRLLRDSELRKVLQYPNATMSGDHFVLPVAAKNRHRVPGVVHRTSPTGETVFIEPMSIANLSAERAVLKVEEDKEVKRVLRRLTADVAHLAKPLGHAIDVLMRLDLITAKAKFSREFAMTAPVINEEGRLVLHAARHPLLEDIFRHESGSEHRQVVPIDMRLGYGFNLLIITGPNTGGKTVTLKTVGLLALMAQSGMHIPAGEGSTLPVFDQVLSDIGDEQSLEQSLSTFSSHMTRIAEILRLASANSLILLDELGAGTDPTEGAALGRAILDHLDRIGCRVMVTTHIGDLKTYALANSRAENAAVEFDHQSLRPTYKLLIGQFGMSNALTIARRLKLPREIINRAFRYLKRRQKRGPELAKLQQMRAEAEQARAEALAAKAASEREREELARQAAARDRELQRQEALRQAREKLQVNDEVHVGRFDKPGRVVRVDVRKRTVLVSVGLGQWEVPLDDVVPVGLENE